MLGLLAAYRLTQPITQIIVRYFPLPPRRPDALVFPSTPSGQFRSYLVTCAVTLGCVALFAIARRLSRRWRRAGATLDLAVLVGAVATAFATSPFFGLVALVVALPLMALLLPGSSRAQGFDNGQASSPLVLDGWALLVQTLCVFWAAWITSHSYGVTSVVVPLVVVAAVSGARVWWLFASPRIGDGLRKQALAGLPLLALPLIGLLRAPSPLLPVLALLLSVGFVLADHRLPRFSAWLARAPRALPALAAMWAVTAIYSIPHRFRELPRINHNSHESGKYAWLNSFYHGKLFMADTALLYGPLRELLLAIYVAIAGKTAEHVRMGQIVIHLGFLAGMLIIAWIAARRQLWALCWGAFLIITNTLALPWLDVVGMLAFGWSDLGRIALPLFAIFGALHLARSARGLAAWGAVAGLSILYSQETGPTAVAGVVVAIILDALLAPALSSEWLARAWLARGWPARCQRAAMRTAAFLGGVLATGLLTVAIYGLFGRAKLFVTTFYTFVMLFASGSLGGVRFPVNEASFASWSSLMAIVPNEGGHIIEFVLPVAVYLVTGAVLIAHAVARRWTSRSTLLSGVWAFGIASFRVAMGRSDYYHLITVTAPAVLLMVALAADLTARLPRVPILGMTALRIPLGPVVLLPVIWGSFHLTGVHRGFEHRTRALLAGTEMPSMGPPFAYPDIPRAGDIYLPPDTIALTRAIQNRSQPSDKIFVHGAFIEHGELYFLADRVNPTRCDILAEIVSTAVQAELGRDLQRDPPLLDVGADFGMFNQETTNYLKSGWREVERVGRVPISVRSASVEPR
jgi:hypothetical protein